MKLSVVLVAILAAMAITEAARLEVVSRRAENTLKRADITLAGIASNLNLGRRVGFRPTNGDMGVTAKGIKRCRVTQTYGGLDVYGASAEVEADMSDQLTGQVYGVLANGLSDDIPNPDDCQKDLNAMIALAIRSENLDPADERIEDKDIERIIYVDRDTETGVLAYKVEFFYDIDQHPAKPVYFINACEETVLFSYNLIQNMTVDRDAKYFANQKRQADNCETTQSPPNPGGCDPNAVGEGGNQKMGRRTYNSPPYCLNVDRSGSTCTMLNTYVRVVDNLRSTTRSKSTPVSFDCGTGYSDAVNGAYGVANDAMFYGDITGRLYVEKYNGFRALSWTPKLAVHYGSNYENAFWDGRNMYFGDGQSFFHPLTSQDVVSHELGHGITSTNSNLEYRRESGGINEAFSDISGEVAEVFGSGDQDVNDWLVGSDIFKSTGALRYFVDPTDDGRSIRYVRDYYDGMDVHYSSGIFNHAFYKLVTQQNIPIYRAYECFLHANRFIWGSTTNFQDGACGVMQAAHDIGVDHNAVLRAFNEVGINLGSCNYDALTTSLAAGETRDSVLVSASRSPIMNVDAGMATVEAVAEDFSTITIEVLSDSSGDTVVASGDNVVDVDGAAGSGVWIRLSSSAADDVKVTLSII